jgi:penicillin-binding protein 2
MANLAATLANGGTRYRPRYLMRISAPDGTVREEMRPEILGDAGLKKSTLAQVRTAMRDVVMSEGGTGKKARVLGIEVAGKTGTSQVVKMGERERSNKGVKQTRDHAWFIAFAPVENPEIAIAAIVEHAGGGGGAIAAPIVQEILNHYFSRNAGPPSPQPAVQPVESPAQRPARPTEEVHAVRPPPDHAL